MASKVKQRRQLAARRASAVKLGQSSQGKRPIPGKNPNRLPAGVVVTTTYAQRGGKPLVQGKWLDFQLVAGMTGRKRPKLGPNGTILYRKDILRAPASLLTFGADGPFWWEVSPDMLNAYVDNFYKIQADPKARRDFCFVYGHGDPMTGHVAVSNVIAPFVDLEVVGDTLYASAYLTPQQIAALREPGKGNVSVRAANPYVCPTTAAQYSGMILHAAVVDQPVLGGQGGWVECQAAAAALSAAQGGSAMSYDVVKAALDTLLGYWGFPLPPDTSQDNLDTMLGIIMPMVEKAIKDETGEEAPETGAAGADTGAGGGAAPPMLNASAGKGTAMDLAAIVQSAMGPIRQELADVKKAFRDLGAQQTQNKRAAFVARLTTEAAAGKLTGEQANTARELGEALGWDQRPIDLALNANAAAGGGTGIVVDLGSTSKRHASAKPVKGGPEGLTQEATAAAIAALGGDPTRGSKQAGTYARNGSK